MRKGEDSRIAGVRQQSSTGEVLFGIALLLALHVVAAIALAVLFYSSRWIGWYLVASLALGSLVLFGIAQVFYAVPLALYLQRQRRFNALKGVAIGTVITIVTNVGVLFFIASVANASM